MIFVRTNLLTGYSSQTYVRTNLSVRNRGEIILGRKTPSKTGCCLKGGDPTPPPCFLAKSSDLPDNKTLRENKEAKNSTKVRNVLIANEMSDPLSAVECARFELIAMSSDIAENKGDVS
jgi:hypothetical protein